MRRATCWRSAAQHGKRPRLVFTSSVAVYGGDLPATVPDDLAVTPQTSYGTQKAMAELLINDYTRRGFVDGRSLRLPTISVRPGRPNAAASSFASGIIREPLNGETSVCPVSAGDARLAAVAADRDRVLHHGPRHRRREARIEPSPQPAGHVDHRLATWSRRSPAWPGATSLPGCEFEPDPRIERMVATWPGELAATPRSRPWVPERYRLRRDRPPLHG